MRGSQDNWCFRKLRAPINFLVACHCVMFVKKFDRRVNLQLISSGRMAIMVVATFILAAQELLDLLYSALFP